MVLGLTHLYGFFIWCVYFSEMIHLLAVLLSEKRFSKVSASIVWAHVPILRDFTRNECTYNCRW